MQKYPKGFAIKLHDLNRGKKSMFFAKFTVIKNLYLFHLYNFAEGK